MATDTSEADSAGERAFVPFLGRYFPGSFALAVLLALAAMVATAPSLDAMTQLELFSTGFYELFTVQMSLILFWVLSATVVESRPVGRLFDAVADAIPTSQPAVIYATGFAALALGWVNWALGLVGGVYIGQKLCRRAGDGGAAVHYPAVLTGALLSLVLANQGPSSPGALLMADRTGVTNFLLDSFGSVRLGAFVLDPVNAAASLFLAVTLPLVLVALAPDDPADRTALSAAETDADTRSSLSIADRLDHYAPPPREEYTLADRLEQTPVISLVAAGLGFASVAWHFANGGALTLLWFLFALVALGLLVHVRPMAFRSRTTAATRWVDHVAIPFLLYAVVFALLSEAGLYGPIGEAVAAVGSTAVGSFVASLALGVVVPDPGSLWVVFGPALAATDLSLVRSLVTVMFGAGLSNLWLGFLFAGVLSLRGFDWREFARYAAAITAYVAVVVLAAIVAL